MRACPMGNYLSGSAHPIVGGLPAGAVPVRASWPDGSVELVEVPSGAVRSAEAPAVALSLDALRFAPGSRRWGGPADAIRRLVEHERLPLPAGLIFHSGRCGSTLLANMLSAHPGLRVLNESAVINQFLLNRRAGADELRTLTRAFSRGLPAGARVVVKTSSWNVLDAPGILAALPGVPTVFIWRHAADVVASCLHSASAWAEEPTMRRWLMRRIAPSTSDQPLSAAEFYARAWQEMTRAGVALAETAGDRVRVVRYDELRARPVELAAEIAAAFGAPVTGAVAGGMRRTARIYSKDPVGRAVFDPGGVHARPELPERERVLVASLTAPNAPTGERNMPESHSVRPEDIRVDTLTALGPQLPHRGRGPGRPGVRLRHGRPQPARQRHRAHLIATSQQERTCQKPAHCGRKTSRSRRSLR